MQHKKIYGKIKKAKAIKSPRKAVRILRYFAPVIFLFISSPLHSQYIVQGRVTDSMTQEPIPLVNIIINDQKTGTTSNQEGWYWIKSIEPINNITFSHISYNKIYITDIGQQKKIDAVMSKTNINLNEITVHPGNEKARRIINNVIINSNRNNYEKQIGFTYIGYNKYTIDFDSTITDNSAILNINLKNNKNKPYITDNDSITDTIHKNIHLFMLESVFSRKFLPPDNNNIDVLASKISGMKDPFILYLINQLQITNIYSKTIDLIGTKYYTPFDKEIQKKYYFNFADTLYTANKDTIYNITFHPFENTEIKTIKGTVSINTSNWSIQQISFEPSRQKNESTKLITPHIQMIYQPETDSIYFPVIIKSQFQIESATYGITPKNLIVRGITTISDIKIDSTLKRRNFSADELIFANKNNTQSEKLLSKYRYQPLSEEDLETYKFIDSIAGKKLDRLLNFGLTLSKGTIPLSFIDINLNDIIGVNKLEGWFLGIGISTNDKLLKWASIYGFIDYGFKNKKIKWGTDVTFTINRKYELKIIASYKDIPIATGSEYLEWTPPNFFNTNDLREFKFVANKFEYRKSAKLTLHIYPFKYLRMKLFFENQQHQTVFGYYYGPTSPQPITPYKFNLTNIGITLRYKYGEKYVFTNRGRTTIPSIYPTILAQYKHYFKNILGSNFEFNKFEISVTGEHLLGHYGEFKYQANFGYIDSPIPFTALFSQFFSYNSNTFYVPYTFAVMRENEFVSDIYTNIFLFYNSPKLFSFKNIITPRIGATLNAGWGKMIHNKPDMNHFSMNYKMKEMNKGYYEAGLMLNGLLNLFDLYQVGFAVNYRFGPYSLPKLGENFSYKLTILLPL